MGKQSAFTNVSVFDGPYLEALFGGSEFPDGELMVDKLKADDIPAGPIYGKLKKGETVQLSNGRVIDGKEYIGPAQKGRIVTILGDTRKTPNIQKLSQNANVVVHESTFGKGEAKLARNYYHSTNVQAAIMAKSSGVERLLLTHISARYTAKMARELQKQAREIFPNTKVVKDFDFIDIPFEKKED